MHKPASGTSCLFMTDSTARHLGYRLVVSSELEPLAATNNQESDAHIGWQNTNPWEVLGERTGPSLHSDHPHIAADGNVRLFLVAPAAGGATADRVPAGVLPSRARPRRGCCSCSAWPSSTCSLIPACPGPGNESSGRC